ncbi:uncharacterized protein IL334_006664 [Kwoniella shivajii]|uniref:RFX1-4/6/8-like BCD domain-containing protein n=1 Tax=Kwoniella shivajii TaxID=564305 RepID=A0ABZ1D890_9TREE|nr:hypothetical protein IL334_006664 [Kwoniella shivajii]
MQSKATYVPIFNLQGFPTLADAGHLAQNLDLQHLWNSFCYHQETLVSCVRDMQFDRYEMNCRTFWSGLSHESHQVCLQPVVSSLISDAMAFAYDHMAEVLLCKVNNALDFSISYSLRLLAERLESIMQDTFCNFPKDFSGSKLELCVGAAQLFARFLDLNQISVSLSPILADYEQHQQMIEAWSRIDTRNISHQCAILMSCQRHILEPILVDFGQWLNGAALPISRGRGVDLLCEWIEKLLREIQGVPDISMANIVCKVGCITSQIVRELILKSEVSFGAFQLVKTFLDDYVAIKYLRQTALFQRSVGNAEYEKGETQSNRSSVSSMNVFIPPRPPVSTDHSTAISTAIPVQSGSEGSLQPNLQELDLQPQYLPVPADLSGDGIIITPRPFARDDYASYPTSSSFN